MENNNPMSNNDLLLRMADDIRDMAGDIKAIHEKMAGLPCAVNSHKIDTHQKILRGAILLVLLAFASQFTGPWVNSTNVVKAGANSANVVKAATGASK